MLEGARRVGKSTIAEQFASKEYKSYILIDFSIATEEEIACFDDINDMNMFFLRLQAVKGITLYEHESIIIFDEVQLFPKARQAIKHLVEDGRYHYIEAGSLISIKKNVKDILLPSEEMRIQIYPMDYEEFCDATGGNYSLLRQLYGMDRSIGEQINRKLLRDLRVYMAVGGMPQAVEAYVNGDNFERIDQVKRQIIRLYEDDFRKIDPSGTLPTIYHSIPAQLSRDLSRFRIAHATGKRKTTKANNLIFELLDSKTVLMSYNVTDPRVSSSMTKDIDSYKLYIGDTGLFVSLLFIDRPSAENDIYVKLLSDKLPAKLGYLYENLVAQITAASGRALFYHTWQKNNSTHYYEIDFLLPHGKKVTAIEVKASRTENHESLDEFSKSFSDSIGEKIILSQKDLKKEGDIRQCH